jgi:hypothetical protein
VGLKLKGEAVKWNRQKTLLICRSDALRTGIIGLLKYILLIGKVLHIKG